jgi:hypothetical protein
LGYVCIAAPNINDILSFEVDSDGGAQLFS